MSKEPMPFNGKRDKAVQFRITTAEHEELIAETEALGMTTGRYLMALHHERKGRKQFK